MLRCTRLLQREFRSHTLPFPMSDFLRHECGLALVRLRRPLTYYQQRHGDAAWGLRRLYLLMEKQHNRGQDGAGLAMVKFDMPPGETYLRRIRTDKHNALEHIFDDVMRDVKGARNLAISQPGDVAIEGSSNRQMAKSPIRQIGDLEIKRAHRYLGELYLGHLRYGTYAGRSGCNCHPFVRKNNTPSRNLAIAGNFNMTNSKELFDQLIEYGLHPVGDSDTNVILERIGYFLDKEHDHLHATMGPESFRGLDGRELMESISHDLDIVRILSKASKGWDGGYVFAGLIGNGDAFVCRDPAGIRPGFFYMDDEVVAAASERAALANVFNVDPAQVQPILPGHVLAMKRGGEIVHERFTDALPLRQCTFERIYFSRGNDPDIYKERKALGRNLAPRVLGLIGDVEKAVFSYIPNTAEAAYMGLIERLDEMTRAHNAEELWERMQAGKIKRDEIERLMNGRLRAEKIAHKDQRLRTFITHDAARRDLVMHIYDITRGIVRPDDALVVLDDSIVRGTTLRESIITILSRLNPSRIVIASSAPPIMYPDCYGIDMSQLGRFIAFEAAIGLLRERGEEHVLDEVEEKCRADLRLTIDDLSMRMEAQQREAALRQARENGNDAIVSASVESGGVATMVRRITTNPLNHVGLIYDRFTLEEISAKVAELVRPQNIPWTGPIDIVYQDVPGLRAAMPGHSGEWYFTGNYPTPGGYRVLYQSFINWRQSVDTRAY